jgi:hypothetical protein
VNYSEDNSAAHQQAMTRPIERPTFEPTYDLDGPHRALRARARRTLITFGIVAAGFFLARLVLRFLFGVQ